MTFPPDTDFPLELLYLAQAALRMPEDCQIPVARGNSTSLVWIDRRIINASVIGTRVNTRDGGYLERTGVTGWVQWRHVPASEADRQHGSQAPRRWRAALPKWPFARRLR